jgi:type II secretory pathway component GspD/PulD (secretin)
MTILAIAVAAAAPQAQDRPGSTPAPVASGNVQNRSQDAVLQALTQGVVDTALYPITKIPVADTAKIPVLDFKNVDVKDILRGLGMQYKINIFTEADATGMVSCYLTNVTVKNAIDFIVKRSGNAYSVENGIVKVYKYRAPPPPTPPAPPKASVTFHAKDGQISIDIKKVSVQEVARMFADSASLNVMVDGGAEGDLSARMVGMKADKAVRALFETNGYDVSISDGIYYVSKRTASGTGGGSGGGPKRLSFSVKDGFVTIDVDNAQLDQVVRSIANESGMNIVVYDRLTGDISAKLAGVPIDDALRFLLQNTKFTLWKEKRIYFIGSREMNQQKTTSIIPLKHIMASEESIGKVLPPNISTNATVKYDKEHNALVVIGSFDIVAQAQEFVEKIDKPVPQVLIEALVVDFNLNKIRDYGVSIFTSGPGDTSGSWFSEKFMPEVDLKPGKGTTLRILNSVLHEIGIDKIKELPKNFRSEIHALESADILKVHSTPQIATINGNPASITIGQTRYYKLRKEVTAPLAQQTAVVGTDERFEVLKFNTTLEVTPWVMEDGYVMVKIKPEFNIPRTGGDASTPPNVDTRIIESMVRLRNGQTIILGGQRQTENIVSRRGVPLLSSIPILGWLFSSRTITQNETQMMIFLTPHVYYGDDNQVSPADYFGHEVDKLIGDDKKEKNGSWFRFPWSKKPADTSKKEPDSVKMGK